MPMRVKMLRPAAGPTFYADPGEERTVLAAHGAQLLAAGDAELIAEIWPPTATSAPTPSSPPRRRKR